MELINSEIVISSLLTVGFESVDSLLYTNALGKLFTDNRDLKLFEFADSELSDTFKRRVSCSGGVFRLKEDINEPRLHTNEKLIKYFEMLDFSHVINKDEKILINRK
jgi:hypothetical protein